MANIIGNRSSFHIVVVILTCLRLQHQVDAGPSFKSKQTSTKPKAANLTLSKDDINVIKAIEERNEDKRGWEAMELSRRKRYFVESYWNQRDGNRESTQLHKPYQDKLVKVKTDMRRWGWQPFISNMKRGWDAVDFPWEKRTEEKSDISKQKVASRKQSGHKGLKDVSVRMASFDKHQNRDRKRGWDGVEFHFDTHKYPKGKGWVGGTFNTGKRSDDQHEFKTSDWGKADFVPDIETHKRGWDGIDFTFGKRSVDNESHENGLDTTDFRKNSNDKDTHKRGWDGVDFSFGRRSVDTELSKNDLDTNGNPERKSSNGNIQQKRGWDGVDFSFGKRDGGSDSKDNWTGMEVVLGVGVDTHRAMREKRGWEGLNLHYRVINAFGSPQSSDYRKRGWEGVDTCVCCHSSHRVLCCLACNRNNPGPKPRRSKSFKDMFYVRDTVCKCCYVTKVKDCCDLCEIMS